MAQVVEYSVSDAAIEKLREKLSGLTAETPEKYKMVREGISEVRELRVKVEKTRKELKADALEYGRKVDAEAKRITAALFEIEEPLKLERKKIDDEKERVKREKEEAERRRIEEENKKKLAAEEAARKAEQERIRIEQEAERKKIEAERAELEKQRLAQEAEAKAQRDAIEANQRQEREKLQAERKKLDEERQRLERERIEREAKERAEREAKEKLEREAERKRLDEERAEQERLRIEAMKPDVQKLQDFARVLDCIPLPEVQSAHASEKLSDTVKRLDDIVNDLTDWCNHNRLPEMERVNHG